MDSHEYNLKLAAVLTQMPEFETPEWAFFVKSGCAKARPVEDPMFWQKRAASVLRQVYKKKIIGVSKLRTKYGSKKNRGMRPEEFRKASGKILRNILQQADKAGITQLAREIKGVKGKKPGRELTAKGKEIMESIN